jgi:hypothetical protein
MSDLVRKNNGRFGIGVAITIGLMFLLAALSMLGGVQPAAADTVPTPVYVSGSDDRLYVTFFDADTTATDEASSGFQLANYEYMDVQFVVDQNPTLQNTTTLTIQWSNDNVNWSDGPALVAANAADADGMVQVGNLGRYTRVYKDAHADGGAMTWTVKAVAK